MLFAAGVFTGLLSAWLAGCLRRLLPVANPPTDRPVRRRTRRQRRAEERWWEQTRNFLRYDGTQMPQIKAYKEERYE